MASRGPVWLTGGNDSIRADSTSTAVGEDESNGDDTQTDPLFQSKSNQRNSKNTARQCVVSYIIPCAFKRSFDAFRERIFVLPMEEDALKHLNATVSIDNKGID